jgi:hypothetical protein
MDSSSKILNPATGRYVKKSGKIGMMLLKGNVPELKPCKEGKIRNEKTKRCVSETSNIGKKILKALSKPNIQTSSQTSIEVSNLSPPYYSVSETPSNQSSYYSVSEVSNKEKKKANKQIKKLTSLLTPSQANVRRLIKVKSKQIKSKEDKKAEQKFRQIDMNKIKENMPNPFYKDTGLPKSSVDILEPIITANTFIRDVNKPENPFYKDTGLPKSSVDILEPIIGINSLIKNVNKPKIKRNKRSMI